jgi:hypothetical protein
MSRAGLQITEVFVQAGVVEPPEVLHDGELELRRVRLTRSAISPVLKLSTKLSASALSYSSPTEEPDRGQHAVVGERLGVVDRRVLPGLNRSSQQGLAR